MGVWGQRLFPFSRVSQVSVINTGQLQGHEYLVVGREMVTSSGKYFKMYVSEMSQSQRENE